MTNPGTEDTTRQVERPRWSVGCAIVTLAVIGITAVRLAATYEAFNGTYDEPYHIASGMEWLDKGTYTYEYLHPPLARVAVAIGPYLAGLRSHSLEAATEEGNAILQSNGNYRRNLLLARLGNLPFLVLACVVIVLWARRWFTIPGGVWALLLFLSLPPILGHAALATLDIACAATLLAALYHLMLWLEDPVWWRSIGLGIALSLALLAKFSTIGFMVVCCAAAAVYWILAAWDRSEVYRQIQRRVGQACIMACVIVVVVWAGYRFSVAAPLSNDTGVHPSIDKWFKSSPFMRGAAYKVLDTPVPLAEFLRGVHQVYDQNEAGHDSYLLGKYGNQGWWYFFPVVLSVKTPLGFLALGAGAILAALWRPRKTPWQHYLTALFPIAILMVCMASRIDLGVRHILSIYPFMALLAGDAIRRAVAHRKWRIIPAVAILAVCTVLVDCWRAHPDYLAYFNQLAGNHPEQILVESDLDWGQDLDRLGVRLRSLGIQQVTIGYFGTAPMQEAGLPEYQLLRPNEKVTGYVAISARLANLEYAKSGAYGWLKKYEPIERIGKSIFLYRIDQ